MIIEFPMPICIQDVYVNDEIVKAKADLSLSLDINKHDTGAILLIIETKPANSATVGLPQLLVCMAAVCEARKDRIKKGVVGMLSDSGRFTSCFLTDIENCPSRSLLIEYLPNR